MPPRKMKKLAEDATSFISPRKGGALSQAKALVDKACPKDTKPWVEIDEESIKVSRIRLLSLP